MATLKIKKPAARASDRPPVRKAAMKRPTLSEAQARRQRSDNEAAPERGPRSEFPPRQRRDGDGPRPQRPWGDERRGSAGPRDRDQGPAWHGRRDDGQQRPRPQGDEPRHQRPRDERSADPRRPRPLRDDQPGRGSYGQPRPDRSDRRDQGPGGQGPRDRGFNPRSPDPRGGSRDERAREPWGRERDNRPWGDRPRDDGFRGSRSPDDRFQGDRPRRGPMDERPRFGEQRRDRGDWPQRTDRPEQGFRGDRNDRPGRSGHPGPSMDRAPQARSHGPDRHERPDRQYRPRLAPAKPTVVRAPRPMDDDDEPRAPRRTMVSTGERLSKRLGEMGLASRREADDWISAGLVRVDGKVAILGQRIGPDSKIEIDPSARQHQAQRVTILLHKPIGYVSGQAEDGYEPASVLVKAENRWTDDPSALKYHPGHLRGLAPAGRLDIDSTGLLVLTQDGRVARTLIGEDSIVEKEYLVRVSVQGKTPEDGHARDLLDPAVLDLLQHGLSLDDVPLKPAKVSWQNEDQLRFVLREGKKRQIRRMCEAVGLEVLGLKRVRIGRVPLGQLPAGQWRYLAPWEHFA